MESFPKKELCRIVKNKENEVKLDLTGKVNGRGIYICKNADCFEKAIKTKRLAKSLEMEIPENIYEEIKQEISKYE
jgi:uncharacterized protein